MRPLTLIAVKLLILTYVFGLGLLFSCKEAAKKTNEIVTESASYKSKQPRILQNATHLKSGDELKVIIQTAPFNDTSNSRVKVDGVDIPFKLSDTVNTAIFVTNIHESLGRHIIPITVTHFIHHKEIKVDKDTVVYMIDK